MLFFAKAAILLLYLRAFRPTLWLRLGVYITLAILFCSYWMTGKYMCTVICRNTCPNKITVPLGLVYCMPHNGNPWGFAVLANCNHLATPGLVQAGMNIAADITIFVLPLPIIAKLQMPTSKKVALAGIFATGILYVLIRTPMKFMR